MLGVTVVTVALAAALLGAWALSTEVSEVDVTVYNPVTDITPLFGTEKAPDYIEYSPSTNYTGYYTDDSIVNNTKYFDGVDYTEASRANQYRLKLAPTIVDSTVDLTTITGDSDTFRFTYFPTNEISPDYRFEVEHITIGGLMDVLGMSDYNGFTITTDGSFDYTQAGSFIAIAVAQPGSGSIDHYAMMKKPGLTGTLTYNDPGVPSAFDPTYEASSVSDLIVAADYDVENNMLQLYYDVEMTKPAGIFAPSDVYVLWSTGTSGFYLGSDAAIQGLDYPAPQYMDPSKGVQLL